METFQLCHATIVIFDNLITLICFVVSTINSIYSSKVLNWMEKLLKYLQKKVRTIRKTTKRILMPEYSLFLQMSWSRKKLGDIMQLITSTVFNENSESSISSDCSGNETMSTFIKSLKDATSSEADIFEDEPDSALSKIGRVILFIVVAYFAT